MGIFLNPGKQLFTFALNSPIYVDKTALIAETNALVNTEKRFLCVSRLEQYKGSIILVGIDYTRSATPNAPDFKHHSCQVTKA